MKNPINILRHLSRDRAPRMPQAVGAAILGAIGITGTGAAIAVATYVVGYIAVTAVTSVVMKALAPKQAGGGANSSGILANVMDPAASHEYVYGKVRKGGVRTYIEATGNQNKYLHMIIVLAGHEVEAIDDIYINDEIVTLNGSGIVTTAKWKSKIRVKKHLGNQTTADANLIAETSQVNSNFIGRGIAYLYIRLKYDQDVFANGIPLFTAGIRGRKVYDPRTSTTSYSANAALAVRDYLTAPFGLNDSAMDDLSFAASANVSDEAIPLAVGGTEARYQVNGIINADMSPRQVMERMMTTCAGTLFWGQGAWQLHVAYYTAPVTTLTLDDLRSSISLDTRASARDNFNRVTGTFIDAAAGYISSDYPPLESATFLAEDYGVQNTLDLQLPMTTSAAAAQRLAKLIMFRAREQMTISAEFGMAAFGVQVGDIVAFTNPRYGWTAKEFEVAGWKFETGQDGAPTINLTLRETSEAAFAWDAEELEIIRNSTNLPDLFEGMDVSGLSVISDGGFVSDGTFLPSIVLSWVAASNAFVSHYEVEWRQTSQSDYASLTTSGDSVEINPILDGINYTARVRAVSVVGNKGSFASITFDAVGDTSAPSAPTSLSATSGPRLVSLSWTNPIVSDLQKVNIYQKSAASPAPIIGTDEPIASVVGESYTIENLLPLAQKFYWVTAVDYSGNESPLSLSASATPTFLDGNQIEDLTLDTIKLVDSAVTKIVTFSSTLPFIQNYSSYPLGPPYANVSYYGDYFQILDYVDDPELRPDIFGALKYSISGTTSGTPEVKLVTYITFVGSGGSAITLAGTQTYLSGDNVYGQHMHNITYASKVNVNGAALISTLAYIAGVSSPSISVQGYGLARQR